MKKKEISWMLGLSLMATVFSYLYWFEGGYQLFVELFAKYPISIGPGPITIGIAITIICTLSWGRLIFLVVQSDDYVQPLG